MPGSPSVYLTFYESSWEEELLFDWGVILFIYLLIFIKIITNYVKKKITLLVIEVNKIVFQRAMCSNSSDSDTTKNSQQNISHHYLFLGSYLWKRHFLLLLPSSFPEAIFLPRCFARIPGCSWPYQDTGKTGSRNTHHLSKQRKAEESTSERCMSQAVFDVKSFDGGGSWELRRWRGHSGDSGCRASFWQHFAIQRTF